MSLVDTHVHLDLLDDEGPALLARAVAAGVEAVITIGVHPRKSTALRGALPPGLVVKRTVGLHPQEVTTEHDLADALAALAEAGAASSSSDVVAFGEMGLDARPDKGNAALHEEAFRQQLRLAKARRMPVVLHGVRRDGRMLEVLAEEGEVPGVWHGFGGSKDTALLALKQGLHIAIGHLVLDERARRVREAIPAIPDDKLMVETDSPPCPPARLKDVVAAVASLRGTTPEHIAAVTRHNVRCLFGF